jgi:hypothetical protein
MAFERTLSRDVITVGQTADLRLWTSFTDMKKLFLKHIDGYVLPKQCSSRQEFNDVSQPTIVTYCSQTSASSAIGLPASFLPL